MLRSGPLRCAQLDNAKTEIEQITAALEMSKQKLGMHDVNSERNILALRKALATTSSAIDTWKCVRLGALSELV